MANKSSSNIYADLCPNQDQPGASVKHTFELKDVKIGSQCRIFVGDYAGNYQSYLIEDYGEENPDYTNCMLGYVSSHSTNDNYLTHGAWVMIDPAKLTNDMNGKYEGIDIIDKSNYEITAAEYLDDYVFFVTDDAALYAAPIDHLNDADRLSKLSDFGLSYVEDMAFNLEDYCFYALDSDNGIWRIDPYSGVAEKVLTVTVGDLEGPRADLTSLAIDSDGNFYGLTRYYNDQTSHLASWRLPEEEDVVELKIEQTLVCKGNGGIPVKGASGSMAWDHFHQKLYAAAAESFLSENSGNYLWLIDPKTGNAKRENSLGASAYSRLYASVQGLMPIPGCSPGLICPEMDMESMELNKETMEMCATGSQRLEALLTPWFSNAREVSWSSSNEEVATVEDGVVKALREGTTVITAQLKADPTLQDTCTVTVKPYPAVQFSALVKNREGALS